MRFGGRGKATRGIESHLVSGFHFLLQGEGLELTFFITVCMLGDFSSYLYKKYLLIFKQICGK